jgi:hypothetical protein
MDGKAHDGGADPVDHVNDGSRIGIKERLVIGGNDGRIGRWRRPGCPDGIA